MGEEILPSGVDDRRDLHDLELGTRLGRKAAGWSLTGGEDGRADWKRFGARSIDLTVFEQAGVVVGDVDERVDGRDGRGDAAEGSEASASGLGLEEQLNRQREPFGNVGVVGDDGRMSHNVSRFEAFDLHSGGGAASGEGNVRSEGARKTGRKEIVSVAEIEGDGQ